VESPNDNAPPERASRTGQVSAGCPAGRVGDQFNLIRKGRPSNRRQFISLPEQDLREFAFRPSIPFE
jgi:hypothetical protein